MVLFFFPDNPDKIPNLFLRQSKADEEFDKSAFELNRESETQRTTQQLEEKINEEETENSNFSNVQPYDGKEPASEQIYKTPVSADPGHLYFTG